MIKIFIVDDHAVLVEGIYALLQQEPDMEVVGHAGTGQRCLQFFLSGQADLVLLDINLPDISGLDLCKQLLLARPAVKILALTTHGQMSFVKKMMEAGACGYLLKNSGKKEMVTAIREVAAGMHYLSFEVAQLMKTATRQEQQYPLLTRREKEILKSVCEGFTNAQTAERFHLSIDTIDTHRKNLYAKLQVNNTAQLMRRALELGLQ
ncbi:response regulator transcription factor [Flavihumibacter sp. CACIAM 22H1]|uniref:response regulator n=1 Tax=Flavihumibacter sp. CACIAM 22H1 TaxID=1812911 RepID=UPI0007A8DB4F|nr:response regulator transcription factor [Flavihumibacter sp. CACIAM 22H1]KYP16283.1 MAG: hypothetical protein A1D16_20305 [Flavihumibacter sp. CACIAM 22H1]